MKRILLLSALLASACQPIQSEDGQSDKINTKPSESSGEEISPVDTNVVIKSGAVRLQLKSPVSEKFACIIPIRVENGLDNPASVTMIGFKVTGPGDDASGNMFAPPAATGEASEARVIIQGQGCDAFDTLSIPEIRCTSGDESCASKVELIDGGGLRFARTG